MKLKHILVLLAACALVVVAWRLRQDGEPGPRAVDGRSGSSDGVAATTTVELDGLAQASGRESALAPIEASKPAEAASAPRALDIVEIGDGLPTEERPFQDGSDAPVSAEIALPDYRLKYIDVDAAGRAQAVESLRNRVRLSKGRSIKEGGMDERTIDRLLREADWLEENPEP